jgi:hypothetical protein
MSFFFYVNILTRIFWSKNESFPGLYTYGGLCGRNLPYKVKICMVISEIVTSKNHIELLVSGRISDRIRELKQILV